MGAERARLLNKEQRRPFIVTQIRDQRSEIRDQSDFLRITPPTKRQKSFALSARGPSFERDCPPGGPPLVTPQLNGGPARRAVNYPSRKVPQDHSRSAISESAHSSRRFMRIWTSEHTPPLSSLNANSNPGHPRPLSSPPLPQLGSQSPALDLPLSSGRSFTAIITDATSRTKAPATTALLVTPIGSGPEAAVRNVGRAYPGLVRPQTFHLHQSSTDLEHPKARAVAEKSVFI